jgi:hypothetical protein
MAAQVVEAIVLLVALEEEFLPRFEAGARSALGIGEILFLQFSKAFGVKYRYLASVFHGRPPILYPSVWACRGIVLATDTGF